jgi:hypothetical protein
MLIRGNHEDDAILGLAGDFTRLTATARSERRVFVKFRERGHTIT